VAESHGEAAKGAAKASGEGTSAHTEAEGGHSFPPFQSGTFPSQLVSLLIAFVALYVIVSRLALPKVGGVIDARQKAIDIDLSEAQRLKDESEAAMKAYESELAAARANAQAIGAETREKLAATSDAERKTLEQSLATKLADAEKSIAATRTAAMSNVRGIAADAASAIVQQLTGKAPAAKSLDAALNASLKGTA
jgi:F-type H+-transporting ATPase subunit b